MAALLCCSSCGRTPEEVAAANRSHEIDKEIDKEKMQFKRKVKILLLGAGESGKSTFLKQMRIIHGNDYSRDDLNQIKPIIYSNILKGMKVLLDARRKLRIEWGDPSCAQCGENLMNLQCQYEQLTPAAFLEHVGTVKKLWKDRGIQEAYKRRNEFQLVS